MRVGEVCNTGLPVPVGVLFLRTFHDVPLNSAGAQSVAEAGHVTSPLLIGKSLIFVRLVTQSALSTKTRISSVVGVQGVSVDMGVVCVMFY